MTDKMERFKVEYDDEKFGGSCAVVDWIKTPVWVLWNNFEEVKLKPFFKFFPNILAPALRETSYLLLSPSSCIGEYITKLVKINADKTM